MVWLGKIRVGMIGAGSRANVAHYPSLAEMPDVEMAAICDLREDRMNMTAERYGIEARFTDYKVMLSEMDLDVVYIIMSPTLLDPVVTYSLSKGKHVFIEKPPGTEAQQTERWAKLAQENGCKTMVGFQRRFHPCVVEARRIVEETGGIVYCTASFHKYGEWQRSFDSLTHDVIHVLDLLRCMGGDVKKVHSLIGQLYSRIDGHSNFYTATLEFGSGGVGVLSSNRTSGGRALYFEMHGRGVSAYGNIPGLPGIDSLLILRDDEPYQDAKIMKNEELIGYGAPETHFDGSFQTNRHFIDCIKDDRRPIADFKDAVKTMKLVEAIRSGPRLTPAS